jgi:Cytochrome c7 and related cytochrome c
MRSKIALFGLAVVVTVNSVSSAQTQRVDYSEFAHRRHVVEQKLTCESCHRFPSSNWKEIRKGDDAFPDITEYPEHKDCLSCHRAQFFARERPAPRICKNCHVNATPNDTARLPFPSLGESFAATPKGRNFVSDFSINFPQDKHADQDVSFKKGTVMHAACFVCHNQESELAPLPQSCGSCHKLSEERTTK